MTWRERLDARIDRCGCGAWRWDGKCKGCEETLNATPTQPERNKISA